LLCNDCTMYPKSRFASQSGIRKEYEIFSDNEMGKGKYGVVRKAVKRKTGEVVAVKVMSKISAQVIQD